MSRGPRLLARASVLVLGCTGLLGCSAPESAAPAPAVARTSPVAVPAGTPSVVFRQNDQSTDNGLVATVPVADLGGRRTTSGLRCDRVYATRSRVACLGEREAAAGTFEGEVQDRTGKVLKRWALAGVPSRVRVSPDGRLVADTSFVTGHEYRQVGFSTATVVRRLDGRDVGNLESFAFLREGTRDDPDDLNIWGVSFARDDRTFYATVATQERTWLVRGDLDKRTLTALRENAECPSLSPDGRHVAYKKRLPGSVKRWRLAVLDLRTGRETVLEERRSVDDQAEWLDDATLLYGLPRVGPVGVSDVWSVGIRPGDRPRLAIRDAWSPSVVR